MDITSEFLLKLSEIASVANSHDYFLDTETIMEGIRAARPDNVEAIVGLAAIKLTRSQSDEAVHLLRNHVLTIAPDNAPAKCVLGIALKNLGDDVQGERLLRESIATGDERNKTIAIEMLSEHSQ